MRMIWAMILSLGASGAMAAPQVVSDIAPVHALVSRVMEGAGAPQLLLPVSADPHHVAMRPSQAQMLQDADVVFWIGAALTPWLAKPMAALAGERASLLALEGTHRLALRGDHGDHGDHGEEEHEGGAHDEDGHDEGVHDEGVHDEDGHDDAHAHDDDSHDDDGHEEAHDGHDEHKDDHADHSDDDAHADHDHVAADELDAVDPHVWLDPDNALLWVDHIAAVLSEIDAPNAALYQANADSVGAEIAAVVSEIETMLDKEPVRALAADHDAFQYFEKRFGLAIQASLSNARAAPIGPSQVISVRDLIAANQEVCLLAQWGHVSAQVDVLGELGTVRVAELDPMGASLDGNHLGYAPLLLTMAQAIDTCLFAP